MDINLRNLLSKHGILLKKAYGQNFLTDNSLLEDIVEKSGVTSSNTVLEIGCGAGALTQVLCRHAKRVVGYEIDTRLRPVLNDVLSSFSNVEIVFNDVLKEKISDIERKLGDDYIIVANLPYYITTPIVMQFIENAKRLKAMIIMVQEEVALRFVSKPSTSDYGAITVGINLRGQAELVLKVGREKFSPPPNVDSAVVKITMDNEKNSNEDFSAIRNVVKCGFSNRRKMFINNIINTYKLNRDFVERIFIQANLPLDVRGENLSAEQYVLLTNMLNNNGVKI